MKHIDHHSWDHAPCQYCGGKRPSPAPLEIGQALMVALLEVRGDLRFRSYGEALDAMHAGLEALADNHAWGSRLAFNCQRTVQEMGWSE